MVYNLVLLGHRIKLFYSMANLFFPLAKLFCHSFLKWLYQFTLPQTMNIPVVSHSHTYLEILIFLILGIKISDIGILCYSLNLHFSY